MSDRPVHPLFPPESPGEDPPEVSWINVTRWGSAGQTWSKRRFAPDELTDEASVHDLFGGGMYELIAKRADGTVSDRKKFRLDGASKPLNAEDQAAPPTSAASSPAGLPGAVPGVDPMVAVIMQMSAQQTQMLMAMMQANQQQGAQMMTAIVAAVGQAVTAFAGQKQGGSDLAAVLAKAGSEERAAMMQLVGQIAQKSGGGGMDADGIAQWMQLGMKMAEGQNQTDPAQAFIGGIAALAELKKAEGGGSPS